MSCGSWEMPFPRQPPGWTSTRTSWPPSRSAWSSPSRMAAHAPCWTPPAGRTGWPRSRASSRRTPVTAPTTSSGSWTRDPRSTGRPPTCWSVIAARSAASASASGRSWARRWISRSAARWPTCGAASSGCGARWTPPFPPGAPERCGPRPATSVATAPRSTCAATAGGEGSCPAVRTRRQRAARGSPREGRRVKVRVASAGTGKTTSLVARFLTLIGEGEPLRRLAGVTFTRSAAAELRERVGAGLREILSEGAYLGDLVVAPADARPRYEEALRELDGATLATIHGFMALGLRLSAPIVGLDPDFGSLPEWEAQAVLEEELEGIVLVAQDPGHALHAAATRLGDRAAPLVVEAFRQRSLAERIEPASDDPDAADVVALLRAAYGRFEARTGASRLAPSEIERRALALTRSPQALARLASRAPRVVVDEYQDVNPLQGRFFAALEAGGVQVEVVGDPKQSIYGFRHADVSVFRRALATGEVQAPLTESRRHARLIVRFLNALTRELSARDWGFGPDEAPEVQGAGAQREARGRVEVHWVHGGSRIGDLRPTEAQVLAERLVAAHRRGRPWREMAVLARTHHGLERVRAALQAAGAPAVLRQGRGYYKRTEIRDLVTALKVGIEPDPASLATWLRGPFGGLPPGAIDRILRRGACRRGEGGASGGGRAAGAYLRRRRRHAVGCASDAGARADDRRAALRGAVVGAAARERRRAAVRGGRAAAGRAGGPARASRPALAPGEGGGRRAGGWRGDRAGDGAREQGARVAAGGDSRPGRLGQAAATGVAAGGWPPAPAGWGGVRGGRRGERRARAPGELSAAVRRGQPCTRRADPDRQRHGAWTGRLGARAGRDGHGAGRARAGG